MANKKFDEYTVHLILLIFFTGAIIFLERIFSESIEGFFYALLPTLLLIIFYILIHRKTTSFEESIKQLLEMHIPNIAFIDDSNTIKAEFINAINDAEKYVMATGGKSRIKEYLSEIETNLEIKEIEYYRIIFGEKITNELHQHLLKVIGKDGVYVSYTPRELAPALLLTEKVAFYCLPDPNPEEFKTCLKIPDEKIIEKLGKYIRLWYAKSTKLNNRGDLEQISTY